MIATTTAATRLAVRRSGMRFLLLLPDRSVTGSTQPARPDAPALVYRPAADQPAGKPRPRQAGFSVVGGRMLDQPARTSPVASRRDGPALDFQEHLTALEAAGLLVRVDRPIDKDTELHPLVRWQFQGGLAEDQRRAFLFTN